jgi:hypothetical protein
VHTGSNAFSLPGSPSRSVVPGGTMIASAGAGSCTLSPTSTETRPERSPNTSSRLTMCGSLCAPGATSTDQIASSAEPRLGTAGGRETNPALSMVGASDNDASHEIFQMVT